MLLETVTTPEGCGWTYTYDSKGNQLTAKIPGGAEWAYTYNSHNRLTKITDNRNKAYDFTCAASGGRKTMAQPDSSEELGVMRAAWICSSVQRGSFDRERSSGRGVMLGLSPVG